MKMHYPTKVESIQSCKNYDTVAVFVDIVDMANKYFKILYGTVHYF